MAATVMEGGNSALRGFLHELFLERGTSLHTVKVTDGNDDDNSCCSSDSDSVTLSSEDETTLFSHCCSSNSTIKTNSSSTYQRCMRYRRSRQHVSLAPDNARAILRRSRSGPLKSASAHSYSNSLHSLGSRNSLSYTSINNWRNSKQAKQLHPLRKGSNARASDRHRDSRWSNSINGTRNSTWSHEFGLEHDSLHNRRRKTKENGKIIHRNKTLDHSKKSSSSTRTKDRQTQSTIDSAVALVSSMTANSELCPDEDSLSMSSVLSFDTGLSTITNSFNFSSASSIKAGFGRRGCALKKNNPFMSSSFTARQGMPKMPQRTRDEGSMTRTKPTVQRSHSDDVSLLSSSFHQSVMTNNDNVSTTSSRASNPRSMRRRSSDPVGRWAAMITTKIDDNGNGASCHPKNNKTDMAPPAPPRRKLSGGNMGYGRFRNVSGMSNYSDIEDSEDDDSLFNSEEYSFLNSISHDDATLITQDAESCNTSSSPKDPFGFPQELYPSSPKSQKSDRISKRDIIPQSNHSVTFPQSHRRLPGCKLNDTEKPVNDDVEGYSSV